MPWKKRLKTTPNDVRRAWLIAAPFVLLGASKAEADTAFTNFAFARATGTGRVNRTMPARLDEIYNVKDFGALGTRRGDDAPAIRAALAAMFDSTYGGTVFFPPGVDQVGSQIDVGGYNRAGANRGRIAGSGIQNVRLS
jgi:hypothetical protein